jgi:hypothetical protein
MILIGLVGIPVLFIIAKYIDSCKSSKAAKDYDQYKRDLEQRGLM